MRHEDSICRSFREKPQLKYYKSKLKGYYFDDYFEMEKRSGRVNRLVDMGRI